jgi:hypothetical protein
MDTGEMSDKRSINQRKVQVLRANDVAALYADEPDDSVLSDLRSPQSQSAVSPVVN